VKRALLFLVLLLLPVMAVADGGIYIHKTAIAQTVSIPDQRALICWSNGTERLAIETRFIGEGTNFAWVVPLPAKPEIEEATTGLFNTLEYLFRPSVIHEVLPFYAIFLVCTGVGFLLLNVRRNTPAQTSDTVVSVGVALALIPISACSGALLVPLLPYVVWRIRGGTGRWWSVLVVLVFAFLLGGMMLPTLGTAGIRASESSGVSVLAHETVGVYDTTTLAATDSSALAQWFENNGYALPQAASRVVSNYVKRGWVFVATKVRRDMANRTATSPHPLCFTFPSPKPVYPMQLTGIGNSNLAVELFVFGPEQAATKHMIAKRCTTVSLSDPETISWKAQEKIPVAHPLLRNWAASSPIATKLVGNFDSAQMTEDVEIEWQPFTEVRERLYSDQGAILFALNAGVGVFAAGLMIACLVAAFRKELQTKLQRIALVLAVCGAAVIAVFFLVLPKTQIRLARSPAMYARVNLTRLGDDFARANVVDHTNQLSLDESRAVLRRLVDARQIEMGNQLLGGVIREEDSPGNYMLRKTTNGVEFFWFDAAGGEHPSSR
jgi:hypothetical protein